jgi:transposase
MGKPGPVKIKNYGIEFKLRAVQLSSQPGVLIKDVAESLCIHPFMLSKWRKQVRDGELTGKPPPVEPAAVAELQRLREVEKRKRPAIPPRCLRSCSSRQGTAGRQRCGSNSPMRLAGCVGSCSITSFM